MCGGAVSRCHHQTPCAQCSMIARCLPKCSTGCCARVASHGCVCQGPAHIARLQCREKCRKEERGSKRQPPCSHLPTPPRARFPSPCALLLSALYLSTIVELRCFGIGHPVSPRAPPLALRGLNAIQTSRRQRAKLASCCFAPPDPTLSQPGTAEANLLSSETSFD